MNRRFLLEMFPPKSIGVEIGVATGGFSEKILEIADPSVLYLVDPWHYDDREQAFNRLYGGKAGSQEFMNKMHDQVVDKFEDDGRVCIRRLTSDQACECFREEYFDWVYIDGNHEFEYVMRDLENWGPLVKIGGLLCGDDIKWGPEHGYPVERALKEFEASNYFKAHFDLVCKKKNQFVYRRKA